MKPSVRTVLALSLLAAASPAVASSTFFGKHTTSPTLLSNPGSNAWFSSYNSLLSQTVVWVQNNASNISMFVSADDDYDTSSGNGENEFTFTYAFTGECGTTAGGGCTLVWWYSSTGLRSETDVIMDGSVSWDTGLKVADTLGYGGLKRPLVTTLLHEFGHALGIGHEARYYNIMGTDWTHRTANSTSYSDVLGEDATQGLIGIYGATTGGYEDLAVSHWKWDSATTGEYSAHKRNVILSSSWVELAKTTVSEQPIYTITKGSAAKVEVTVENNGALSQSTNLRLYLSSDSNITTSDTLLSTATYSFTPDTPSDGYYPVTWPSTLTSGATWYVGACVDVGTTLSEKREDNNCAYISQLKVK